MHAIFGPRKLRQQCRHLPGSERHERHGRDQRCDRSREKNGDPSRSQARAALQDTLLQTTQGQLELAKARQAVGAGTILDVRRAEVAAGNSEIQLLQAHNTAEVEMLRLFQQLGVSQPDSVQLATRFEITPVNFNLSRTKNRVLLVSVQFNEAEMAEAFRRHCGG